MVVALQILSISLFVQDFEPIVTSFVTPEINIINTIDEYIAEVILNHKDAVPENVNHSKKDIQIHKHVVFKLICFSRSAVACATSSITHTNLAYFSDKYYYQFFEEINRPPQTI